MAKPRKPPPPAAAAATAAVPDPDPGASAKRQLTCFVVTGFGNKTDYATGRVLNLDKTYELLVQPACDAVHVNAFRAIDANLAGSIDAVMYRWIYQADLVIADLSTLNANVFYELGVRHAQRPNTTLIIAESVLIKRLPFDLSSFVVHQYEHGGETISAAEQTRFVALLAGVMRELIAGEQRRASSAPQLSRQTDSPVFLSLKDMAPPAYTADTFIDPPAYLAPALRKPKDPQVGPSLASIIDAAEAAKKRTDFAEAVRLFSLAITRQTEGRSDSKPDIFLAQRLALVTYKQGERKDPATGQTDPQTAITALLDAQQILQRYCEPNLSNDPETLGLSGAIHKRLFDLPPHDAYHLEQAIRFYERGFYVKRDYYNGINVAFMYNLQAQLQTSRFDAIVSYGHANLIRQRVAEICEDLIKDEAAFAQRGDQEWVYLSLAEAYQGLGRDADEARLAQTIQRVASPFGLQTYQQQRTKLQAAMDSFAQQVRPDSLDHPPGAIAPSPAPPCPAGANDGHRPISIDANILPGRQIRSIEVNCKIEYS